MEQPNPLNKPAPSPEPSPMRDPDPVVTPMDEDKNIEGGIEVNET